MIIDKICESKLNQSNDICSNLTHHDDIEIEVQKHVTDYEALYSSISFGPKYVFNLIKKEKYVNICFVVKNYRILRGANKNNNGKNFTPEENIF